MGWKDKHKERIAELEASAAQSRIRNNIRRMRIKELNAEVASLEAENTELRIRWDAGFGEFLERIGVDGHTVDIVQTLNQLDEMRLEDTSLRKENTELRAELEKQKPRARCGHYIFAACPFCGWDDDEVKEHGRKP